MKNWGNDFPRINSIHEESSQRDPLHWKCMLIFELLHMKEIELTFKVHFERKYENIQFWRLTELNFWQN
jgi:hypothetical protein